MTPIKIQKIISISANSHILIGISYCKRIGCCSVYEIARLSIKNHVVSVLRQGSLFTAILRRIGVEFPRNILINITPGGISTCKGHSGPIHMINASSAWDKSKNGVWHTIINSGRSKYSLIRHKILVFYRILLDVLKYNRSSGEGFNSQILRYVWTFSRHQEGQSQRQESRHIATLYTTLLKYQV